jgi:hypothetical protein
MGSEGQDDTFVFSVWDIPEIYSSLGYPKPSRIHPSSVVERGYSQEESAV